MDCCVKMGIGGLNGRGLFVGESSIVLDALESLIPDLQRFSPWISDQWSRPWSIHLVKAVVVAVVVVESGCSEERCLKEVVLLGLSCGAAETSACRHWGSMNWMLSLLLELMDMSDTLAAVDLAELRPLRQNIGECKSVKEE